MDGEEQLGCIVKFIFNPPNNYFTISFQSSFSFISFT